MEFFSTAFDESTHFFWDTARTCVFYFQNINFSKLNNDKVGQSICSPVKLEFITISCAIKNRKIPKSKMIKPVLFNKELRRNKLK